MQPIVCTLLLAVLPASYMMPDPIPARYDVLIHEILADPSPTAGLPDYEFIELKNVSPVAVNLGGWVLKDSSSAITLPAYILQPDSFVVICSRTALPFFSPAIAGSLSLANEGERLALYDKSGQLIHSVDYRKDWYGGSIKENGGWSLEMIDTKWPCAGAENWKASVAAFGGTPGKSNSVAGNIPEPPVPALLRVSVTDSLHLQLHFSGMVDSLSAVHGLNINNIKKVSVDFNSVAVELSTALEKGKIYSLQIGNITDCNGRPVSQPAPLSFALPERTDSFDIIINEVLFDPPAGAADFAEIYNRSNKAADLQNLYFASYNTDGSIKQPVPLVKSPFLLLPGEFLAFSTDLSSLCRSYSCKGTLEEIGSLPTLPDNEGTLLLITADGRIIDALHYNDNWHLSTLPGTMGISLERIQADGLTQDPGNWHSAAATAGYATPGYVNSQRLVTSIEQEGFSVYPEVFSPDNDGRQDITQLRWELSSPGFMAQITVFDGEGRPVRHLAKNQLLGNKGNMNWNGLSDTGEVVRPGIYVIFIRIFNMQGRIKTLKLPLVLAGTP